MLCVSIVVTAMKNSKFKIENDVVHIDMRTDDRHTRLTMYYAPVDSTMNT